MTIIEISYIDNHHDDIYIYIYIRQYEKGSLDIAVGSIFSSSTAQNWTLIVFPL